MKRALALLLALLPCSACQTTPGDSSGSDGNGGMLTSGGSSAGGSGGQAGGSNNPDGTLHTLACKQERQQWIVGEAACSLYAERIEMRVAREVDSTRVLLAVVFGGSAPGLRLTEYGGSMMAWQAEHGESYVQLASDVCFGPASFYTPDPCEIELLAVERGEIAAGGAGGGSIEVGSRVRVRVSCPHGLYSPGADDFYASLRTLVPSEFELEAHDCLLLEE